MCGNGNAMSNEQFKDLMMMTAIPIEEGVKERTGPTQSEKSEYTAGSYRGLLSLTGAPPSGGGVVGV